MSRAAEPVPEPASAAGAARLSDVVRLLERRYPPGLAESWDAVGTVCGDPDQPVRRVLLAIDATTAVVDEALEWGADLLWTHHPLLLRAVHGVAATTSKGAAVHRLVRGGCALHVTHTNADAPDGGVPDALAAALGVGDRAPLVPRPTEPLDKVVVMVPVADEERLVDALAAAGAGAIGEYHRCAWTTTGIGTFVPGERAEPAIGERGFVTRIEEARVEMVAPRRLRDGVVAALRATHPYEEPAFDVLELASFAGRSGGGRVGDLPAPMTLGDFARRVAQVLPPTAQGVRVAGDLAAPVRRVAVVGGSGDSFFDAVRSSGADVYVTGDLRHHPALELRERARFEAAREGRVPEDGRPFLVDVAHSASEWPWLARAAADLADDVRALGTTVETRVSAVRTDPWTAHVPSPTGGQP
ncbi:Nif3-like dinuclear metal center hexameric protein [Actinotalea fermentans]|uniref:Nif3-like dinuclear metal center hexameric protein n=1 Tax=Actinotalea fermentans TaxID=43671 RepID=UPI000A86FA29|nr:Nif3-like dinuclear metal center hexameric protein [Actinotalea fermentans]